MLDEKQLVTDILMRRPGAFETFVIRYERLVFHMVRRLVKYDEDVEDVCQEVYIQVDSSLKRFKFESKLSTWVARVAYLTALGYLKKQKRQNELYKPEALDSIYFTEDNPEKHLIKKDITVYLEGLILQLPLNYRTVLTLYHINEFSCLEIEQITGMPEGTIKSYLFRARCLLKDKIVKDEKERVL
jgi:RNA polymerase sigma factor (sigma-70 family)